MPRLSYRPAGIQFGRARVNPGVLKLNVLGFNLGMLGSSVGALGLCLVVLGPSIRFFYGLQLLSYCEHGSHLGLNHHE